ncbi:MerR family transcriptional regulator, partial [Kitasatospora sp. NPDC059463]|uniref:MerR family transcriptional regulator n=1 Tax=Kitasatospora sp. NPDC059463 TaxID=3346842 RepID=UPI0036C7FC8C
MTALASIEAGLRTCCEVFRDPAGVPDRTSRHTIGEVSAASGLTAHTLRWYERIGLLDPVDRSASGQRRYSDADLHRLAFLGRLRLTGMPVADMLRYVELAREGERTSADRGRPRPPPPRGGAAADTAAPAAPRAVAPTKEWVN